MRLATETISKPRFSDCCSQIMLMGTSSSRWIATRVLSGMENGRYQNTQKATKYLQITYFGTWGYSEFEVAKRSISLWAKTPNAVCLHSGFGEARVVRGRAQMFTRYVRPQAVRGTQNGEMGLTI